MDKDSRQIRLAVDTSGRVLTVALSCGAGQVWVREVGADDHARQLQSVVEELLAGLSLSGRDVPSLAINIGPGSFTGLRIGLAFLKGFALGVGLSEVLCVEAPVVMAVQGAAISEEVAVVIPVHARRFFVCSVVRRQKRVDYLEGVEVLTDRQLGGWLARQYGAGRRLLLSEPISEARKEWKGNFEVVVPSAVGVLGAIEQAPHSTRKQQACKVVPFYVQAYKDYL